MPDHAVFRTLFTDLKAEMQKAIVGYDALLSDVLVAIFSGGHVLLEGVPGLGKTYLVRTLSQVVGLEPGRVQCTPDLMPADILGTHIVGEDEKGHRTLRYEKGPVFKNLLLVDEINRATPKTQAALLEVMQERCVTTGGERHLLPEPFFVLATQNPMEMEGTYPLPEAQLDRFLMKILIDYPSPDAESEIVARASSEAPGDTASDSLQVVASPDDVVRAQAATAAVQVVREVVDYAVAIVQATREARSVWLGAGTRGAIALVRIGKAIALMHGRHFVIPDDIKAASLPVLRHRVQLAPEVAMGGQSMDEVLKGMVESGPAPRQ